MPAYRHDNPIRTLTAAPGADQRPCHVYFIGSGPYIKIGVAEDPHMLLRVLQIAHPTPLELVAYFACVDRAAALKVEHQLHTHYASAHVSGEWFKLSHEDLLAHIELLIGFTQAVVVDTSDSAAEIARRGKTIAGMKRALDHAYDILMRVRAGRKLTMREAYAVLAKNSRDAKAEILLGLSYERFPDGVPTGTIEDETQPVTAVSAPAME
jgi:hypothetical protein